MSESSIVIVGASLAGQRAAEHLRRGGFAGRLTLIGAEPERPYDRPPLSKKFLHLPFDEEKLFLRPPDFYTTKSIELVTGRRARSLDARKRVVALDDGTEHAFDQLLIATGAEVVRLACKGADLRGVHYVRSLSDARAVRAELETGRRAVVIGAGVIGCEVAAACRDAGVEVVLVESAPTPLIRAFGAAVGAIYADVHRARGVDVRCGVSVAELRGENQVTGVVLSDGETVPCDFVVVGIGVRPSTSWLDGSGVAVEGGLLVDPQCRTNVAGIYGAGDVTRYFSTTLGRHTAVESVDNAQLQAATAADGMLGKVATYDPVPFFWSDQYHLKLQIVGHVGAYDRVVIRGSVKDHAFVAFHMVGERVAFAVGVNRLKEIGAVKKQIAARASFDDTRLANDLIPIPESITTPGTGSPSQNV